MSQVDLENLNFILFQYFGNWWKYFQNKHI